MEMHAKCQKFRAPAARVAPTQQTSSFTLYTVLYLAQSLEFVTASVTTVARGEWYNLRGE